MTGQVINKLTSVGKLIDQLYEMKRKQFSYMFQALAGAPEDKDITNAANRAKELLTAAQTQLTILLTKSR